MGVIWVKMEIFEPEATGRNSVARKRKKLPQIGWCQNDRNFGGFAAVHSDFYVFLRFLRFLRFLTFFFTFFTFFSIFYVFYVFVRFFGPQGAWGQFFSEYRQVGYSERRNDIP